MDLSVISTSWGSYIVHKQGCPTVDFDWDHHGVMQYEVEASSKAGVAQQIQDAENSRQRLAVFQERLIPHHCIGYEFPGFTELKAR